MFGANFFVSRKHKRGVSATPFESLHGRKSFIMVEKNEIDEETGQMSVKIEKQPYMTNKPLTPQSGIATKEDHLSFMFKANKTISQSPEYLSLQGANPYETARNVAGLADQFVKNNVKFKKEDKK